MTFSDIELRVLAENSTFTIKGKSYHLKRAPLEALLACERIVWASTGLNADDEEIALGVVIQNELDTVIKVARERRIADRKKLPIEAGTAFRRARTAVDIETLLAGGKKPKAKTPMNGRRRCTLFRCHCGAEFARRDIKEYPACCRQHSRLIQLGSARPSEMIGSGWIDSDGNVTVIEKNGVSHNG